MKYFGRPVVIFLLMFILALSPVFAIDYIDFDGLQRIAKSFSDEMVSALPFNSTIGLNWSDAYIGSFPHFGIGLSTGLTTMDNESIRKMMEILKILNVNDSPLFGNKFFLPAYSIDARIGLPVIPVDFGVKFGYLHPSMLESLLNVQIKNMLIGADVRYAVINSKVLPMRLSIGLGFNYLDGGISGAFPDKTFNFIGTTDIVNFNADDPNIDIIWKTTNIEFKMQASFPYKILTPYAGAGISYAWSQAGYRVSSKNSINTPNISGITKTSDKSFETINKDSGINTRVFGGFSFNLAYLRFDLTGTYEILNGNFGATFGLRYQM
jgi:hypothetical protein